MFMSVAIGVIGIGIFLIIGYMYLAKAKAVLPSTVEGNITIAMENTQSSVIFAFSLVATGIIILIAFGLIAIFK